MKIRLAEQEQFNQKHSCVQGYGGMDFVISTDNIATNTTSKTLFIWSDC